MKATIKDYRQSPRKVRLVADMVRGKTLSEAELILKTVPRRAAQAVLKALSSAAANAKENFKMDPKTLVVKEVRVDEGATMKRWMPRAMGRASKINKRTSHIAISLSGMEVAEKGSKAEVVAEEKEPKAKPAAKKKTKTPKA